METLKPGENGFAIWVTLTLEERQKICDEATRTGKSASEIVTTAIRESLESFSN